jgi:PKD repeat protein
MSQRASSLAAAAALVLAGVIACDDASRPPRPTGMEPSAAPQGAMTQLVIRGTGFNADVRVSFADRARSKVASRFAARLGDTDLESVLLVDSQTLTAVLPRSIAPGIYDLTVIDPQGRSGKAAQAFTVTTSLVVIEDAPDGAGVPIGDLSLMVGGTKSLFAVLRDEDGGFRESVVADWLVEGDIGALASAVGPSTVFTAITVGIGTVSAWSSEFGGDTTGTITTTVACNVVEGPPGDPTCGDNVDNDCDGLTDALDSDCQNDAPVVELQITPGAGTALTAFVGDASATTDRQQSASTLTYDWDWDGDGAPDATGMTCEHTFSAPGEYTVVLAVTDREANVTRGSRRVWVVSDGDLFTVTTDAEELDSGATPTDPKGAGLSVREALSFANATTGPQTVLLPAGIDVKITNPLIFNDTTGGTIMVGTGAVIDGSAMGGGGRDCVTIDANSNQIVGLVITGCGGWPIDIKAGASDNRIERCHIYDNAWPVYMAGANNTFGPDNEIAGSQHEGIYLAAPGVIERNWIHDSSLAGIHMTRDSDGSLISQNTILKNGHGIELARFADTVRLWHNTIVTNRLAGVMVPSQVRETDCRNNLLAGNAGFGVEAADAAFGVGLLDYNDYYDNGGACSACSTGAHSLATDPLFVDATAGDLRLKQGSPLIDAGYTGADLIIDVNGDSPGNFNGAQPDIGAFESP